MGLKHTYLGGFVNNARLLLCAFLACLLPAALAADPYPSKAIRIIVPAPPGGGSDISARLLSKMISPSVGQQLMVDNRPGAAGIIAAELVARAEPDGYTLFFGHNGTNAIHASLYKKLPYDPQKDFVPIIGVASVPAVIFVHKDVPAQSLAELVQLAKSKPGKLRYGSSGIGSPQHITGEYFKTRNAVDILHIPYKGSAPALAELSAGQIEVGFDYLIAASAFVKAGSIRALAICGPKRLDALPGVPTAKEAGLPDFELGAWTGFFAPAKTPAEIVAKFASEVTKTIDSPERKHLQAIAGSEAIRMNQAEFASFVQAETAKWAKLVKASGAQLDY